jgi:hypothetical protein
VTKDAADDFVEEAIVDLLERGSGVDLVASTRELEAARGDAERATAERKAFVKLASALDEDVFRAGYEERRQAEAERWHAYDELLARASDTRELPADGTAWRQLDLPARRRVARSLIDAVVVSPPASRSKSAPISDRFAIHWASPGQVAGAGR